MRIRFALLLVCLATAFRDAGAAEARSPWSRVVIVGASASAGFVGSEVVAGTNTALHRLSRYVDAALLVPHEPVENLAHALFFVQPETTGRRQIEDALDAKPTLVIGIDFLFWYCYGEVRSEEERPRRFETGLKLLEKIPCPIVVGDIPDASAAVATGMLQEKQVPTGSVRTAANQRLKDWAGRNPRVIVVPLATFLRDAMGNRPITVRGHTLPEGRTRQLLQDDLLHPTPRGAALLAVAALDAFCSAQPRLPAKEILWNPQEVFRHGSAHARVPAVKTDAAPATSR